MKIFPVLARIGLAKFDSGDLGESVGLVGWFQHTRQKGALGNRLRSEFRVDARAPKEEELSGAEIRGGFDHIVLDGDVLEQKFHGLLVVGSDSAHFGRGVHNDRWALLLKKGAHGAALQQIEFQRDRVRSFLKPARCNRRTTALPTIPRWPAT